MEGRMVRSPGGLLSTTINFFVLVRNSHATIYDRTHSIMNNIFVQAKKLLQYYNLFAITKLED